MSNRKKPNSPSPLRAALAKKTNLRTHFDISIAPVEECEAAARKLAAARQMVMATLLQDNDDVRAKAAAAESQAQAGIDACFHRVWFRGLAFDEFDALVNLHPPTPEQLKDKWSWNPDTFSYALLEHCVVDSNLTAAEWEAELSDGERWSRADRVSFLDKALAAQQQTMADAVPKD